MDRLEYLRELWGKWMSKVTYRDRETEMYRDAADRIKAEIEELERRVREG